MHAVPFQYRFQPHAAAAPAGEMPAGFNSVGGATGGYTGTTSVPFRPPSVELTGSENWGRRMMMTLPFGDDGSSRLKTVTASQTDAGGALTRAPKGLALSGGFRRTRSVKSATDEMAALGGRGSDPGGRGASTSKADDGTLPSERSSVLFVKERAKTDTVSSVLQGVHLRYTAGMRGNRYALAHLMTTRPNSP